MPSSAPTTTQIAFDVGPPDQRTRIVAVMPDPTMALAELLVPQRVAVGRIECLDIAGRAGRVELAVGIGRRMRAPVSCAPLPTRSLHIFCTLMVGGISTSTVGGSMFSFLVSLNQPLIVAQPTDGGGQHDQNQCALHEPFFSAPPRSLSFISTNARFGAVRIEIG